MRSWLGWEEIASTFKVGRTTAFTLMTEYEKSGGEVFQPSPKIRRVPEKEFTEFFIKRGEKCETS